MTIDMNGTASGRVRDVAAPDAAAIDTSVRDETTAATTISALSVPTDLSPLTPGITTWDQTVLRNSDTDVGYQTLRYGPGEPHVAVGSPGHVTLPIVAFVQMTDLHIVDDQSPARLEFLDRYADVGPPHFATYPTDSAYRPHEYLSTQVVDAMCQAISSVGRGPVTGLPLKFTVVTGDAIDNCQHNENRWYIDLLDGGRTIVPDSGQIGKDQSFSSGSVNVGGGVGGLDDHYYYPSLTANLPDNIFTGTGGLGFPQVPGLLDQRERVIGAARRPFVSHGLGMPWYSAYGNHDAMWQGNQPIDSGLLPTKEMATGNQKVLINNQVLPDDYNDLGIFLKLVQLIAGLDTVGVFPDADRRLLTRKAFIQDHFNTDGQPVGHGFQGVGIDKAYYAIPSGADELVQFITLDTTNNNDDGFGVGDASGSLDDVQFSWLEQQLKANSSRYVDRDNNVVTQSGVTDKLFVLFGHHTIATMGNLFDGTIFGTGDDRHSGEELEALMWRFPNVIAFVNGHTHANRITFHAQRDPSAALNAAFWEISTASHIDWPIQSRLIEIGASAEGYLGGEFGDTPQSGTISIFTTMLDPAAPLAFGGDISSPAQLASLARELCANDPQEVAVKPGHNGITQRRGGVKDRNTQLTLFAPFPIPAPVQLGSPIAVARNADGRLELFGTDQTGKLWNTHQRTVSGDLVRWNEIGTGWVPGGWSSVTARPNEDGRIEVFATDATHDVRFMSQVTPGSGSSGYSPPDGGFGDGSFASSMALSDESGRLELFGMLSNGLVFHRWQNTKSTDDWHDWIPFGVSATQLAAECGPDGRAVLVGIDYRGRLFQRKKLIPNGQTEAEWGPVLPLDGELSSLTMARNLKGRLAIFGTNRDGQVWQRHETAVGSASTQSWTPWQEVPTPKRMNMRHIAAERNGHRGRIELHAIDSTGMLYRSKQRNPDGDTWSPWASLKFNLRAGNSFLL